MGGSYEETSRRCSSVASWLALSPSFSQRTTIRSPTCQPQRPHLRWSVSLLLHHSSRNKYSWSWQRHSHPSRHLSRAAIGHREEQFSGSHRGRPNRYRGRSGHAAWSGGFDGCRRRLHRKSCDSTSAVQVHYDPRPNDHRHRRPGYFAARRQQSEPGHPHRAQSNLRQRQQLLQRRYRNR